MYKVAADWCKLIKMQRVSVIRVTCLVSLWPHYVSNVQFWIRQKKQKLKNAAIWFPQYRFYYCALCSCSHTHMHAWTLWTHTEVCLWDLRITAVSSAGGKKEHSAHFKALADSCSSCHGRGRNSWTSSLPCTDSKPPPSKPPIPIFCFS